MAVNFVHAAVGVVPQRAIAEGQGGRGFVELVSSDLGEILAPGADRLAAPALLAARRADQVNRDSGARVPQDQASTSHGLVVGVCNEGQEAWFVFHSAPQFRPARSRRAAVLDLPGVVERVPGGSPDGVGNRPPYPLRRVVDAYEDGLAKGADRRAVPPIGLLQPDSDSLRVLHFRSEDVVEHVVAIPAAATRAFAQVGRRLRHDLVEVPPARFEEAAHALFRRLGLLGGLAGRRLGCLVRRGLVRRTGAWASRPARVERAVVLCGLLRRALAGFVCGRLVRLEGTWRRRCGGRRRVDVELRSRSGEYGGADDPADDHRRDHHGSEYEAAGLVHAPILWSQAQNGLGIGCEFSTASRDDTVFETHLGLT